MRTPRRRLDKDWRHRAWPCAASLGFRDTYRPLLTFQLAKHCCTFSKMSRRNVCKIPTIDKIKMRMIYTEYSRLTCRCIPVLPVAIALQPSATRGPKRGLCSGLEPMETCSLLRLSANNETFKSPCSHSYAAEREENESDTPTLTAYPVATAGCAGLSCNRRPARTYL